MNYPVLKPENATIAPESAIDVSKVSGSAGGILAIPILYNSETLIGLKLIKIYLRFLKMFLFLMPNLSSPIDFAVVIEKKYLLILEIIL